MRSEAFQSKPSFILTSICFLFTAHHMVLRIHEFQIFTNAFARNQLTTEEVRGHTGTGSRVSKHHNPALQFDPKASKTCAVAKNIPQIKKKIIIHANIIIQNLGALECTYICI